MTREGPMPLRLDTQRPGFARIFADFLALRETEEKRVSDVVAEIITSVRTHVDQALLEYTRQFDRFAATAENIKVTPHDIADALALCQPELMTSLKIAAKRIREYSERQMPAGLDYTD